MRYKNSAQNKPNPVILRAIYQLQWKLARFSENMNANVPSRNSAPTSLDAGAFQASQVCPSTDGRAPLRACAEAAQLTGDARQARSPKNKAKPTPNRRARPQSENQAHFEVAAHPRVYTVAGC